MIKHQDYNFYIFIKDDYKQTVSFTFHTEHLKKLGYLDNQPEFSTSENVQQLINNIEKVQNGVLEKIFFGAEDALDVYVYKEKMVANDLIQLFGYDKEDKTEHNTQEFVEFLKEWKSFLQKYENNEIPNLNNPNSKIKK